MKALINELKEIDDRLDSVCALINEMIQTALGQNKRVFISGGQYKHFEIKSFYLLNNLWFFGGVEGESGYFDIFAFEDYEIE